MSNHRYKVGDEVETVTGAKARVTELFTDESGQAFYWVETDLGKATWSDEALK